MTPLMRTIEIEVSEESKALTGVPVVTLRSPRIGAIKDLPLGLFDPKFMGFITVGDMLKVIAACLDGTVDLKVIEQMEAQDVQVIFNEACFFFSPSGEPKIRRNGFPKAESPKSESPAAS